MLVHELFLVKSFYINVCPIITCYIRTSTECFHVCCTLREQACAVFSQTLLIIMSQLSITKFQAVWGKAAEMWRWPLGVRLL